MNTQPPRFIPLGIIIIALTLVPPSQAWAKTLSTSGPGAKGSTGGVQKVATGTETAATDEGEDGDADDTETEAEDTEIVEVPTVMPNAAAPTSSDLILSPVGQGDSGAVLPIAFKGLTAEEYGVDESATYTFTKTVTINGVPQKVTQTLTVKEILAELNQIEEGLNAIGYTLRDKQDAEEGIVILKLESQSKEEEGSLQDPAQITRKGSDTGGETSETRGTTGSEGENSTKDGEGGCASDSGSCTPQAFSYEMERWEKKKGDKDIVKFETWFDMSSAGYDGKVELHTDSETAMWLLGNKKTLMEWHSDATAKFASNSGSSEVLTGTYKLEILGDSKINETYDGGYVENNGIEMEGEKSKSVKISKSMRFWVGPVPVKVELTLKGTPSFEYYQNFMGSTGIKVHSEPGLKIRLNGSASVNLAIVEAGVGVKVTALDAELNFDAGMYESWENKSGTGLNRIYSSQSTGTAEWTVLAGKVYVYVDVHIPFAKDKHYKMTIFDWDGIGPIEETLFDRRKTGDYYVPEESVEVYAE